MKFYFQFMLLGITLCKILAHHSNSDKRVDGKSDSLKKGKHGAKNGSLHGLKMEKHHHGKHRDVKKFGLSHRTESSPYSEKRSAGYPNHEKMFAHQVIRNVRAAQSSDVIELTDSNFDELVLNSDDMWLVEFFLPWCGYCQNLQPHWAKAAKELHGKVKFGAIDATVNREKATEYWVQAFPTIKYFPRGKKTHSSAETYHGGRTAKQIINFAVKKLKNQKREPLQVKF